MQHNHIFNGALDIGDVRVPHFFLCHYRAVRFRPDALSRSIVHFKNDYGTSVPGWADCATAAARSIGMDRGDILVRPLGSSEEWVPADGSDKPLDWVCRAMAQAAACRYLPDLLVKRRKVPALYGLDRMARREAVRGAYAISRGHAKRRCSRIWIVDDVLTTGATVSEIAGVLMDNFPRASLSVFTLAKAENNPIDNTPLPVLHGARYRWSSAGEWTRIGFRLR